MLRDKAKLWGSREESPRQTHMRFSKIGRRNHLDTVYRVHRNYNCKLLLELFVSMLLRLGNRHKKINCKNVLFS